MKKLQEEFDTLPKGVQNALNKDYGIIKDSSGKIIQQRLKT